jgi:hypothetical protein
LLVWSFYGKVRFFKIAINLTGIVMSKKIVAAAIIIAGGAATVPFYLSGYFAANVMNEYTALVQQANDPQFKITNITQQPGLYQSSYGFDIEFDLNNPAFASVKDIFATDQLKVRINNALSHDFLSVVIDTSFDGQIKASLDKYTEQLQKNAAITDKPWASLATTASFSLLGDPLVKSDLNIQAFDFSTTDKLGEVINVNTKPMSWNSLIDKDQFTFSSQIDNITVSKPNETLSFDKLAVEGVGHFADLQVISKNPLSLIKDQNMTVTLDGITVTTADNEAKMLSQMAWRVDGQLGDSRSTFGSALTVAKAGNPTIPMTMLENMTVDFLVAMGTEALTDYSTAMQKLTNPQQDPAAVLASFAHLVSENIVISLKRIKADTFAGLLDITGNIDLAAMDMTQFQANPNAVVGSLSYAAQGQVPRDLLMMSAQMSAEVIDNLLEQQMIEEKDEQIIFKLTGAAGHVELNDKPLI